MDLNYIQRNDLAWARDTITRLHSGPLETRQARYSMETLTRLVDEYDRQDVLRGEAWRATSIRRSRILTRARLADIHAAWQRQVHAMVFGRESDWMEEWNAHAEAAEADAHASYIQAIEGCHPGVGG